MTKNYIIPLLAFAALPGAVQAKVINPGEARSIAAQFINPDTQPDTKAFKVQGANASAPYFYVFNDNSGNGFVLVAGDDCVTPVLGYSHTGKANPNDMPPALKAWLESVSQYICNQRQKGGGVAKTLQAKDATPGTPVVEPIVKTHWSQDEPYFNLTPTVDGAHTLTCCVATAMAQVFNHYKYPAHGTGVLDYAAQYDQDRINIDLAKSTYDWSNMANDYTTDGNGTKSWNEAQANAVATLMRDIGAALHVQYGINGSGAYTEDIRTAAVHNFGYKATTYYKTTYSMKQWTEMLRERFDAGNPVVITGVSKENIFSSSGHAFVGDGYDSNDNIHINWGWAGKYDGYYNFYKFGPENFNFNINMDFTEFTKDESGTAADNAQQPILTTTVSSLLDSDGNEVKRPLIRMDADKFDAGIRTLSYCVSWDKYEGKIKMGLYDEEGNTMLGTVGEEREVKRDLKSLNLTETDDFRFKPSDFANLKDGNYQLVLLANNTADNDNWVKTDNEYIIGLRKKDGKIMLTLSIHASGHLTQKGEVKFDKETYDLGSRASVAAVIANNSDNDFGDKVYAHFVNVDTKETVDLNTGLNVLLFSGDENEFTSGKTIELTNQNKFTPGKYEVTLWQYDNGEPVLLDGSKPATINIVENPKTQPKLFVKQITLDTDDGEIEVNPDDILNICVDDFPMCKIRMSWEKAEIEPEYFSTIIYCIPQTEGVKSEMGNTSMSISKYSDILTDSDMRFVLNADDDYAGHTTTVYVVYSLSSVAGNTAFAKFYGTDKNVKFKVKWTDEPTAIKSLNSTCTKVVERWNAQGMRLNGAEKGLNIVKYSDGSIRKVIVK